MSAEEDIELKNLVAQTLENKGVLPKIRAELRANVFLALEENPSTRDTLLKNDEFSSFLKMPFSTLILNLIREFLEFFELEFTLSVFEPETKYGMEYSEITRDKMIKELKMADSSKKNPLLLEVIHRVVNNNMLGVASPLKNAENLPYNNISDFNENTHIKLSPVSLNTTFVKKPENDSLSASPTEKESRCDTNESIKEEVTSNNYSEEENLSEAQVDLDKVSKVEIESKSYFNDNSKDSKLNATNIVPKETIEIDLLTFTPVKEEKVKDKIKNTSVLNNSEVKTEDQLAKPKSEPKSGSVLGDLPPLTVQSNEKKFDMTDIKAIIEEWPGKLKRKEEASLHLSTKNNQDDTLSGSLKSDLTNHSQNPSPKSEKSDTDDFEEDISDLMNGHNSLGTPVTIDETISKVSCAADYLESL